MKVATHVVMEGKRHVEPTKPGPTVFSKGLTVPLKLCQYTGVVEKLAARACAYRPSSVHSHWGSAGLTRT